MKKSFIYLIGLYLIIVIISCLISCGNKKEKNTTTSKEQDVSEVSASDDTYLVDKDRSTLGWKGCKDAGCHNGTIQIKEGTLAVDKNDLIAGSFTVDMKTIVDLDLKDIKENDKLVADISSDNFFDVKKYPTTKFEITASEKLKEMDAAGNNYLIKGNLTIKDVTRNISFPAKITIDQKEFLAKAKFSINRSEFNLKYGKGKLFKGIGDKIIHNPIEFNIDLVATIQKTS